MLIREAEAADAPAISAIIMPTIREGATYALDPELTEAEALAYWMAPDKETFVAVDEGVIVGTYYVRPNQGGGGRHVCNWLHDRRDRRRPRCCAPHVRAFAGACACERLQGDAVQLRR